MRQLSWPVGVLVAVTALAPGAAPAVAPSGTPTGLLARAVVHTCEVPVGPASRYDLVEWRRVTGRAGVVRGRFGSVRWERGTLWLDVRPRHDVGICVGGSFMRGAAYSEEWFARGPRTSRTDLDMRIFAVGYGVAEAPLREPPMPRQVASGL